MINFLNREKDHLMSIVGMCYRCTFPQLTSLSTEAEETLEDIKQLRQAFFHSEDDGKGVSLSHEQRTTILDLFQVQKDSPYLSNDRKALWRAIGARLLSSNGGVNSGTD